MSFDELSDMTDKDKRFIAACHAMNGFLTNEQYIHAFDWDDIARKSIKCANALIKALGEIEG